MTAPEATNVLRDAVLILVAALLVAGCGLAASHLAGWPLHLPEMGVAAVGCLIAAGVAVVVLGLAHGGPAASVSQSALLATLVHMFIALTCGAIVMLSHQMRAAFMYWLLAFYVATLLAVVSAAVRAVRSSSVPAASTGAARPESRAAPDGH